MSKRRTKIPAPTWEHEHTGITRKLEANRWQLWATACIVLLVAAALGVIGFAFLSDYIEDQQRPGSLGLRVAERELSVEDYTLRTTLFVEQIGTNRASSVIPAVTASLIEEALILQFADERSVTASEDDIRAEIATALGIDAEDTNFDARLQEEVDRSGLSEEEIMETARADVLLVNLIEAFRSEVSDSLPSVNYREIQVADQETADDLVAQLNDGADFATLAEQSLDTLAATAGGDKGWVPEGILDESVESGLFALEVNEITTIASANTVSVYEVLEKSDSHEVEDGQKETLARSAYTEWLIEKQGSVEIVNEMDLQTGDGDKINWVIDHAFLTRN